MAVNTLPQSTDPATLRQSQKDATLRPRDLADQLGVSEAHLLAARTGQHDGHSVTRIDPHPDRLMPALEKLGPLMALTRNDSIVSEVTGTYGGYRAGDHAALVLGDQIDLRIFPKHWVHGFAVEAETKQGLRRSFQIFDAAGDAIHKVYLPLDADPTDWLVLRDQLATGNTSDTLDTAPREAVEDAITDADKVEKLRSEWDALTDTHQFLMLTRKLRINRLGAYRMAGEPYARRLPAAAFGPLLTAIGETGTPAMIFVGNQGCIQIKSGSYGAVKPMGPWLNYLDPGFDMHLRNDHVAEVWVVTKPTRRGPAVSVEAFDDKGGLITQIFGHRTADVDHNGAWMDLVAGFASAQEAAE
ncbi:hemin-degrading factor [Pseudooceanicola nitratireducens]|uniref:hemin-degrading factor n=1 Tax=Pseudooceanicola nitratireducens TaxID=517719 RepID=UPI0023F41E7E|nr:ChuX/HutX family heme-like substrate-binding protein [Pseudooceanicola nitratireducens]